MPSASVGAFGAIRGGAGSARVAPCRHVRVRTLCQVHATPTPASAPARPLSGHEPDPGDPGIDGYAPRIVKTARDENADVIGRSCHSWEYLHYIDERLARLSQQRLAIPVVVGGSVLTAADERLLWGKGVAANFGSTSSVEDIPGAIRSLVTGARRPRSPSPPG